MKTRLDKLETHVFENTTKVAVIFERLDKHDVFLDHLEQARHKNSGRIHVVEGILTGIDSSVNKLTEATEKNASATEKNTKAVDAFKIMVATSVFLVSIFISICSFIGGKIMMWW